LIPKCIFQFFPFLRRDGIALPQEHTQRILPSKKKSGYIET
jgi:hypothetical protein